ncbi:transcription elongation factor GreA [Devosia sp. WQ 349]|uniref:transcription elongation factor GreA n=1 Tax=Devosia sp. WQ 349K1 TaxID=2800329 RepID=UPI001908D980|nr:transcription elongation factor GreA [Devosia sp. WQ 349K1]MBK1793298.1 transcription elongation factor GreA [Devosia sp. WQ 349K1]
MSVAFTKEDSAETASETMLPDRPIPDGPNLVTAAGLEALEAQLLAAKHAYDTAMVVEDINERRRQAASPYRDIRYYSERIRTAQVVENSVDRSVVAFGTTVTFEREDGRVQTYRIVGEDEADPKSGTISFSSPIARALMGKGEGDVASVAGGEVEILRIG